MASVGEIAREQAILSALQSTGRVVVTSLAEEFEVSAVTIRKDLQALERRNLLRRVRGGATGVEATDEGAFEMRLRHARVAKRSIARAAARLVHDGDVITVDSSTTVYYLLQELLTRRDLVVVTNGLRHAMLLMERSSARVVMPGGALRRSAASLVGPLGDVLSGRGQVAKGFFGIAGLSLSRGLLDVSGEEAMTKRSLVDASQATYGLFDSSKVAGFGLHSFARTDEVSGLFTDAGAPEDFVDTWRTAGVDVHVVAPDATGKWPRGVPTPARPRSPSGRSGP